MALRGQQLRLRTSHRCNRGTAIAHCVAALKGKHNNPEGSKVASRYNSQYPLSPLAPDWVTESDCCKE